MSTKEPTGHLSPELSTPVTDLSKCAQGEPLSLQQIYERVMGAHNADPAPDATLTREPIPTEPLSSDDIYRSNVERTFPRGPFVTSEVKEISQSAYDELERVLSEHVAEINAAKQESTMASQDSIPASPLAMQTSFNSASIIQRRSMLENVSEAHNNTKKAIAAMTDLIAKMFGAEAAKTASESYTGIGPMPAAEAGIAVNTEYMLRDISEMAQKIEAQARVISGELG